MKIIEIIGKHWKPAEPRSRGMQNMQETQQVLCHLQFAKVAWERLKRVGIKEINEIIGTHGNH